MTEPIRTLLEFIEGASRHGIVGSGIHAADSADEVAD